MHNFLVLLGFCLLFGASQREWGAQASYAAVSYWNNSDCSGPASFTQAYASDFCFDFYDTDAHVRSNLNARVNATHAAQYFYETSDCSGGYNVTRSFVAPIGVCVFGPTPYGKNMHQIAFFADSAGPYSTISGPSWSYWSYDSCSSDYVLDNQIDSADYCWNMGDPTFSWKEAGCDEDFFYFHIYETPDCSGPFSFNTSLNREQDCIDEYTNLVGESARIKCVGAQAQENELACAGSVELVERSGAGALWEVDGNTYKMFDVVVKNIGECSIVNAMFLYSIEGNITQSWDLFLGTEGSVVIIPSPILPGNVHNAAGLIVADYKSHSEIPSKGPAFICSCDKQQIA